MKTIKFILFLSFIAVYGLINCAALSKRRFVSAKRVCKDSSGLLCGLTQSGVPGDIKNIILDYLDPVYKLEKKFNTAVNDSISSLNILTDDHGVQFLISGSADKNIRKWDIRSGEIVDYIDVGRRYKGHALTIMPDGRFAFDESGKINILNPLTGDIITTMRKPTEHRLITAIFALSNDKLIYSDYHGIKIWDINQEKSISSLADKDSIRVMSIAKLPENRLALGDSWGSFRIWDLTTETVVKDISLGKPETVITLFLESNFLCTGDANCELKFWDLRDYTCKQTIKCPSKIASLATDKNQNLYVGLENGEIYSYSTIATRIKKLD